MQNTELNELKNQIKELQKKLELASENADVASDDNTSAIEDIYSWEAPDRLSVAHSKSWYVSMGFATALVIFVSLVLNNFVLVFVVVALIFLIYAMSSSTPQIIRIAITNKGIRISEDFYLWKDIEYFWVSERDKDILINLNLKEMKGQVTFLGGNGDTRRIVSEMIKHEDYREPGNMNVWMGKFLGNKHKKVTEFATRH